MALSNRKDMVNIGKITTSVGLKGEVRVMTYSGKLDNVRVGGKLHYETLKGEQILTVSSVRRQKDKAVVKFEEIPDIDVAEKMRDIELYIHEDDLLPLPDGQYYVRDMIDMEVYDEVSAQIIGLIKDLNQTTAQDVYIIEGKNGKEIMIPDVEAFIKDIDMENRRMTVSLIPGFLD